MAEIRLAGPEDIELVMAFYRKQWNPEHPLGMFRELMEFQHLVEGDFRYVIAEENGELCGVMGYILYNEEEHPDLSTTMVCTSEHTDGILSLEMTEYLERQIKSRYHYGVGMNPDVAGRIVRARGGWLERMRHFYRLNDREQYKIACINRKEIVSLPKEDKRELKEIYTVAEFEECLDEEWLRSRICYKSKAYFVRRYWQHPVYIYRFWRWKDSMLIGRIQDYDGAKVLRISEWIGEDSELEGIGVGLDRVMRAEDIEYTDMYCYGISPDDMKRAGFTERREVDENVIPNYFNPFVRENKEIYLSLGREYEKGFHAFRGDSDQDRPAFVYRIEEQVNLNRIPYWLQRGYVLADRTIQVNVPLKRSAADFRKQIRMEVFLTHEYRDMVWRIAEKSFPQDTRFRVTIPPDEDLASERVRQYLADKDEWFVCRYKEEIVGFIVPDIVETGRTVSVYLAAVDEKYRTAGAALSLYHYVAQYYKELGYEKMTGIISSRNTAVANVWVSLGASFGETRDIFLRMR